MSETTPRRAMSATRRLRIFNAHGGKCVLCGARIDGTRETWTIEHIRALGLAGEDTDDNCGPAHERCRRAKDKDDMARIAKAKRQQMRHLGAKKSSRPMPGSKASGWRKRMDGSVERR